MTIPDYVVGLKEICEDVIASAIADDQSAFKHQRRLEVAGCLDLMLTPTPLLRVDYYLRGTEGAEERQKVREFFEPQIHENRKEAK